MVPTIYVNPSLKAWDYDRRFGRGFAPLPNRPFLKDPALKGRVSSLEDEGKKHSFLSHIQKDFTK